MQPWNGHVPQNMSLSIKLDGPLCLTAMAFAVVSSHHKRCANDYFVKTCWLFLMLNIGSAEL